MSAVGMPLRPIYHLRIFVVSLTLVILALSVLLFGVQMEAKVPANGIITAPDMAEMRALLPGLIETGWYGGEVPMSDGVVLAARLDRHGNGHARAPDGKAYPVQRFELVLGDQHMTVQRVRFHELQPGDVLWPGQVLAEVRNDDLRLRLDHLNDQIAEAEKRHETHVLQRRERDRLRDQLAQGVLHTPINAECWLVLEVKSAALQAVTAGERIAQLVAVDPQSHAPRKLTIRLIVDEKHWGSVQVGHKVRVTSNVYHPRLNGRAEAVIERLEPWGEAGTNGQRYFHAVAAITGAPFAMPLGSSCQAEIILGRKLVYRIILEH